MELLQTRPWALVAIALAALLGLQTLRMWWSRAWPRLRLLRRSARARSGEEAAADLLRGLGYTLEDAQATQRWTIAVDGEPLSVGVRADYLVTRNGKRYAAEVKTGESAPSLRTAATRRQLLEYRLAYATDGVLLVDMERGRVHEVEFPLEAGSPARQPLAAIGLALCLGIAIGLALGLTMGRYSGAGASASVKAGSSNIGSPASAGSGTSTSSRP